MKLIKISALALMIALCSQTYAKNLKHVYLDNTQNVHVVTLMGKDLQLTTTGHHTEAKLSPDGKAAAWLVSNTWIAPGEQEPGASELVIYRNGLMRSIKCEPFIREYWFWMKGERIVIDCGGSHFAGREILYDIYTLKELDRFDQAVVPLNKRPLWGSKSEVGKEETKSRV